MPDKIKAVCKFFDGAKGFGFLTPEDGGKDVFVHASAVKRAGLSGLKEGDKVIFEMGSSIDRKTDKPRPCAENLSRA